MDSPLWTDVHEPSLDELVQDDLREYLQKATDSPLNLFLYGPRGSGKSAAVNALTEEAHDDPDNDVLTINASDFFDMSKSDLADDERFSMFIDSKTRRNLSKAQLMIHVVKELASYQPVAGSYKTLIIDNAEAMRRDFQQALRRVMERYHQTTQFVLITRSASGVIPAIKSRCSPLPVRSLTSDEIKDVLDTIADREDIEVGVDAIEFLAGYADGDVRRAILALQTVASKADPVTVADAHDYVSDVGMKPDVVQALKAVENGDIKDARSEIDDLLVDEGLTGEEVLRLLVSVAHGRYETEVATDLVERAADIDVQLRSGANDRVHLTNFLTDVAKTTAFA